MQYRLFQYQVDTLMRQVGPNAFRHFQDKATPILNDLCWSETEDVTRIATKALKLADIPQDSTTIERAKGILLDADLVEVRDLMEALVVQHLTGLIEKEEDFLEPDPT